MEKEEALNILNGYMGGEIDPENTELYYAIKLVVDILDSQPSLPTDLNKAAHRYAWDKQDMAYDAEGQVFFDYGPRYDSFKAVTKWMSEQGMNIHGRVLPGTYGNSYIESDYFDKGYGGLSWNDEVDLIVRKKQ